MSHVQFHQPEPSTVDRPVYGAICQKLSGFLPHAAVSIAAAWFCDHSVSLKITRARRTKLGDFKPGRNGSPPVISINSTLNPYAFLITLVHEMAHFSVPTSQPSFPFSRRKYRNPHSREWQAAFASHMEQFLASGIFPEDMAYLLAKHLQKPKASTHSDLELSRALARYDPEPEGIPLEQLPPGRFFTMRPGTLFQKERKLRRRYRCLNLKNRKIYLIHPLIRVTEVIP